MPVTITSLSTAQTANSTSWTLNVPAHVAGDILLMVVGFDGNPVVNSIGAVNGVAWTLNLINTANGTANKLFAAWLRATSDQATDMTVVMAISASEQGIARCWALNGSHTTTAPAVGTVATGSSASPNPPALNPAGWDVEEAMWFALVNTDAAVTATAFPSNMETATGFTDVSGGGNGAGLHTCRLLSSVASLDPNTFTLSATETWVAQTVAIRPAPEAPAQTVVANVINQSGTVSPPSSINLTVSPNKITQLATILQPVVVVGDAPPVVADRISQLGVVFQPEDASVLVVIEANKITQAPVLHNPTVVPDQTIEANKITNLGSVFNPTVVPGEVTVEPNKITQLGTVASPDVVPGGITVQANEMTQSSIVYEPSVAVGETSVAANKITQTVTVYQATIVPAAVTVEPDRVTQTPTLFSPSVSSVSEVQANFVSSSLVVFAATVTQLVEAQKVTQLGQTFTPSVQPGAVTVAADKITQSPTAFSPDVSQGLNAFALRIESQGIVRDAVVNREEIVSLDDVILQGYTVYSPIIVPGDVSVSTVVVQYTPTLYVASVDAQSVVLTERILQAAEVFDALVEMGDFSVITPFIPSALEIFLAVVTGGETVPTFRQPRARVLNQRSGVRVLNEPGQVSTNDRSGFRIVRED